MKLLFRADANSVRVTNGPHAVTSGIGSAEEVDKVRGFLSMTGGYHAVAVNFALINYF